MYIGEYNMTAQIFQTEPEDTQYVISYTKRDIVTPGGAVFTQMPKGDKQLLLNILENSLLILAEAQHDNRDLANLLRKPMPALGVGKYYKKKKVVGLLACLSGMLKQHRDCRIMGKEKDFTVQQLNNIQKILPAFKDINQMFLAPMEWPHKLLDEIDMDIVFKEL